MLISTSALSSHSAETLTLSFVGPFQAPVDVECKLSIVNGVVFLSLGAASAPASGEEVGYASASSIPQEFRPSDDHLFPLRVISGDTIASGSLEVKANGFVIIHADPAFSDSGSNGWRPTSVSFIP